MRRQEDACVYLQTQLRTWNQNTQLPQVVIYYVPLLTNEYMNVTIHVYKYVCIYIYAHIRTHTNC